MTLHKQLDLFIFKHIINYTLNLKDQKSYSVQITKASFMVTGLGLPESSSNTFLQILSKNILLSCFFQYRQRYSILVNSYGFLQD